MQKFLPIFFFALYFASVSSASENKIEVQGHRGARARAPENTLPAFEHALEIGADAIELDLAVTKDDVLVISHHPFISKEICLTSTKQPLKSEPLINSLTLAQVKTYDCGTLKNKSFPHQVSSPGATIPTLQEVFDLVRKSTLSAAAKVEFNIETKIYPKHPEYTVSPEKFIELVMTAFRTSGFIGRIILESFDPRTLVLAKKLEPTLRTSLLVEGNVWSKLHLAFFQPNLTKLAKEYGVDIISPRYDLILSNPKLVKKLHKNKIQVLPWTVNDEHAWDKLISLNVDGIITDDPEALLQKLNKK